MTEKPVPPELDRVTECLTQKYLKIMLDKSYVRLYIMSMEGAMQETLTISKGNQYDRNGYYLASDNGLYAFGEMDGERVTFDGTWFSVEHKAAAEYVIRQVITDGQERQLTVGEAPRHTDYRPLSQYPYGSRGSHDDCE